MKNVSHKKGWFNRLVQIIVDTRTITLIKSKLDANLDKYYVKIKFCLNTM